jgi:hypothetical protein
MKQDKGLTLIALVITIIILLIFAGISISVAVGNNGIIVRATTVESTFNQGEVLEELKNLTAAKYLEAYNETLGKDIETKYNTNILLAYFAEDNRKIINSTSEDAKVETDSENGYIYYSINIDSLKRNITKYGKGNWTNGDVYAIRRAYQIDDSGNTKYSEDLEAVYKDFVSNGGEITVIGSIDVNSPVK